MDTYPPHPWWRFVYTPTPITTLYIYLPRSNTLVYPPPGRLVVLTLFDLRRRFTPQLPHYVVLLDGLGVITPPDTGDIPVSPRIYYLTFILTTPTPAPLACTHTRLQVPRLRAGRNPHPLCSYSVPWFSIYITLGAVLLVYHPTLPSVIVPLFGPPHPFPHSPTQQMQMDSGR